MPAEHGPSNFTAAGQEKGCKDRAFLGSAQRARRPQYKWIIAIAELTSMPPNATQQQPVSQAIEQLLQRAIVHYQAGRLLEAGRLYQGILQTQPNHPEANYNLGVIAVQAQQPAAGVPYFMAALDVDPTCGKYWLNYIDALFQADQLEDACAILALARQQGLQGNEVDALAARMGGEISTADQSNSAQRQVEEAPPNSPMSPLSGKNPSHREMDALVTLFNKGRYTEATTLAQRMTERFPLHEFGWKTLGAVLKSLGRGLDALEPMRKAAALSPDDVESHYNLGVTLQDLGHLDEAEARYRRALQINADYADAYLNLGVTLNRMGRLSEAEESLRQALQKKPNSSEAHGNLGAVLQEQGRLDEAEASYRRALQINPDDAGTHNNLGIILQVQGRLDEVDAHFQAALQINPEDARTHDNRGNLFNYLGRLNEAETSYRKALQIAPDDARRHANLGRCLFKLQRWKGAATHFLRALEICPDDVETHAYLGVTLQNLGLLDQAEACFRHILRIKPNYAGVMSILGNVLQSLGRQEEAETCVRQAQQIMPDHALFHSNLLYFLSRSATAGAESLFAEHVKFGEQFESPLRPHWPDHINGRDPERCLRIGFVSADFWGHAVASFIEPVLTHLSGYAEFSLYAYYNNSFNDDVTQRLRGHFAHWHPVEGLSDAALSDKIRADGIDILIDLSGHTAGNRLLTFARKPAPVQASWIGYPGTTGLKSMDYFLADRFFLPPGQLDGQFTEKIVHLPAGAPYLPAKDAPPVNRLPALSNGHFTFGSFNRPNKLSPAVIAVWAQLLRALPDSRMLLGGMPEDGNCEALIKWFETEGVARERLSFHARCGTEAYLNLHQQVDICLDTFPYNGGTTILHALWMGVPTLTLAGRTAAGRSGAAILGHAGLESFVAHDAVDFLKKGLFWTGNLAELSDIRSGLRERFTKSAMGQPAVVATGVERALRMMWQRWCADLPAESFEVPLQAVNSPVSEVDS
jgi:protein O-GlcNAc transferase